jgi:pimeloyl-ACP methyl ester carboxylesterase
MVRINITILVLCGAVAIGPSGRPAWGADQPLPAAEDEKTVRSDLFGAEMVNLTVAETRAFILRPAKPPAGQPKPWVWLAPSLTDAAGKWTIPAERHAWLFKALLEGGFHIVGIDVGESYGNPAGRAKYEQFYQLLVKRYGLSEKPVLLPVSRGGLMAYNWAAEHPEHVGAIGGIYPICNIEGYASQQRVTAAYGLSAEQLRAEKAKHSPIERLAGLAAAKVPILHVHGDRDTAVPLETNSAEMARRYAALGGRMEVVVIPGKGHEVVPELWQDQRLLDFLRKIQPKETQR